MKDSCIRRTCARALQLAWLLACTCVLGCSSAPPRGPYFGDEQFLTFGVDPDGEARTVIAKLEAAGHPLAARTRGRYFVALGFEQQGFEQQGSQALVRIVTARGIALALDPVPSDALQVGVRYALLLPPEELAPDVDGDGNEEVFVAVLPYDGGEACLAAYRVQSGGAVERVAANVGAAVPSGAAWSRLLHCEMGAAQADAGDGADSEQPEQPEQPAADPGPDAPGQDAGSSPAP